MNDAEPRTNRRNPRRWFRFSLRTLFVALTIACLWLGFEVTQARRQRAAVQELEKLGAYITYDVADPTMQYEGGVSPFPALSPVKQWIADWLGKDYVATVVGVHVSSPTVRDSDLTVLADLPKLQILQLNACRQITDAALVELPASRVLECIQLNGTRIGDEGVKELTKFPSLRSLSIAQTRVTNDGLAAVGQLDKLERLELGFLAVDDEGFSHLRDLVRMRDLTLTNLAIGDESFRAIGQFQDLEGLHIDGAEVTDAGLAQLGELKKLKGVWLKHTQIQGAGLRHFAQSKGLIVIRLNGCPLNEEAVPAIASVSSLWGVDLRQSTMSAEAVAELQKLRPRLQITPP